MSPASGSARRGWYYGWNIVGVCILAQVAAMGLAFNAFSLFLHGWAQDLHVDISKLQLCMLGLTLGGAIGAPVIGVLADKLAPRRLFATGLLGMALFYFAVSRATAFWQLAALYSTIGTISMALSSAIPCNAVISRWFVRRRGLALGFSAFGIGFAGVILPPIVAWALPKFGWRAIWEVGAAALVLIVAPVVALVVRDRPTEREGLHYVTGEASGGGHHGHGGPSTITARSVLARPAFWLMVAAYVPILALQVGVLQNIAPYAASRGLSGEVAGTLVSVISVTMVASTLVLGLVSDRFGNRVPYAALAGIMALGAALLAFGSGLPTIVLACALLGSGGGQFTLLTAALAGQFGGEGVGRAYGLCMMFVPLTQLGPFFMAKVEEVSHSYTLPLIVLAALTLVGGGLILLLREDRQSAPAAAEPAAPMTA
jgi:sugar phosphate permease